MREDRTTSRLCVLAVPGGDRAAASCLAERLGISLHTDERGAEDALIVRFDRDGVALAADGMELRADLSSMASRLRRGRLERELLVRAAKVKGVEDPVAVDATAGFGEDSLLLAAAGFKVLLFEHDAVIAAMLRDALRRAAEVPALAEAASRMCLAGEDSVQGLAALEASPDVVYLDPMFPERRKSAAVKKKFQLLHRLERPCDDEDALLRAAVAAGPRKVVVKRPVKGPFLAGAKPSYSLAGKAVRYDCIVPAQGGPAS